jgi:protein arginine kinase activator
MKCEACRQHEATVAYTHVAENAKKTMYLCASCAEAQSGAKPAGTVVEVVIESGAPPAAEATADTRTAAAICPACGLTYEEFRKLGRLGCHACYAAFGPQLEKLLRRVHGARRHVGKGPIAPGTAPVVEQELATLRQQLRAAVAAEAYEQAAQLRDRITQLERESGRAG